MRYVAILFFSVFVYGAQIKTGFENTNYIFNSKSTSDNTPYTYDYNRFRFTADLYSGDFAFKLVTDNENIISDHFLDTNEHQSISDHEPDIPFETRSKESVNGSAANRFKLYRVYGEYIKDKHIASAGLMRVPFGVGMIWTPVDVFNPINSFSLETDEREGVFGTRYAYSLNTLSSVEFVLSQTKEHKTKKAARVKGFLDVADFAVLAVESDNINLIGYEFDSEILDTKIGFRSEGGEFENKDLNIRYTKYIAGIDYGFENSFTVAVEYLYDGADKSGRSLGIIAGYQPSPLWSFNFVSITNMDDKSLFYSPSAVYSLSDEQTLTLGMSGVLGDKSSEFGTLADTYYTKWYMHF